MYLYYGKIVTRSLLFINSLEEYCRTWISEYLQYLMIKNISTCQDLHYDFPVYFIIYYVSFKLQLSVSNLNLHSIKYLYNIIISHKSFTDLFAHRFNLPTSVLFQFDFYSKSNDYAIFYSYPILSKIF